MTTKFWAAAVMVSMAGFSAFGQAPLPAFHSGPWYGAGSLPLGWTQNGMGGDYATNYDAEGGNAGKFDGSGDWLQVNVGSSPSTVSYWLQGNGLSGAYSFKVQQSANGSAWTDVATYGTVNPINSTKTKYTNELQSTTRYVRFLYDTKASGNVGIDGVTVAGMGLPSIHFDPAGSQSIPVSNELALAVSVSPSGSGIKSWGLAPTYAGASSLAGGMFRMTPASGDANKTFTLSVVATNAIGGITGTVSVLVTPYVPPVPVLSFSPPEPYSIMAGETQRIGIGVAPVGSGIQGWTLTPGGYAGAASLAGTNFAFASATTDGPSSYVFSVVATNVHGATTATASIAVSAYVPPPPPGSIVVDFEDAPSKSYYSMTTNTLSGRSWLLGGATSSEAGDKKFDTLALRIRVNEGDNEIKLCNFTPFAGGVESISFWYAMYGSDSTNNAPQLSVQISTNLNAGWITLSTIDIGTATELTPHFVDVKVREPIYARLWAPAGGSNRRANIDNVVIAPFVEPTGYEAYLLGYNVTPGDPGTETGDDLDGDGFTNQQEYQASPKTNPYDAASHP
jgi:hypothetical protein